MVAGQPFRIQEDQRPRPRDGDALPDANDPAGGVGRVHLQCHHPGIGRIPRRRNPFLDRHRRRRAVAGGPRLPARGRGRHKSRQREADKIKGRQFRPPPGFRRASPRWMRTADASQQIPGSKIHESVASRISRPRQQGNRSDRGSVSLDGELRRDTENGDRHRGIIGMSVPAGLPRACGHGSRPIRIDWRNAPPNRKDRTG